MSAVINVFGPEGLVGSYIDTWQPTLTPEDIDRMNADFVADGCGPMLSYFSEEDQRRQIETKRYMDDMRERDANRRVAAAIGRTAGRVTAAVVSLVRR